MTTPEVEAIKSHFDKVARDIRTEFQGEITRVRGELRDQITFMGKHADFMVEGLRNQTDGLRFHASFRLDALTSEVRIRCGDLQAEVRRLRESNEDLRRQLEALEARNGDPAPNRAPASPMKTASAATAKPRTTRRPSPRPATRLAPPPPAD